MEKRPLVLILGDSLLMEGIAASLTGCPQLSLICIDYSEFEIWQKADSLNPDVILFEMETPHSPFILSLLEERPGILLLGLDLSSSRVIVLNSRQHYSETMHDLWQIVEAEIGAVERPSTPCMLEGNAV
jgi:chemotaxis response regulator CheB